MSACLKKVKEQAQKIAKRRAKLKSLIKNKKK